MLVVDATQGVEAQTLSTLYMAIDHDLEVIPVINKIDLPGANVESVTAEIISLIGCSKDDIIPISAKMGTNVEQVLDAICERIPDPKVLDKNGTPVLQKE